MRSTGDGVRGISSWYVTSLCAPGANVTVCRPGNSVDGNSRTPMWRSSCTGASTLSTFGIPRMFTSSRATTASPADSLGWMMPLADIVTPTGAPIETLDSAPADGVTGRGRYVEPTETPSQSVVSLPSSTVLDSADVATFVTLTGDGCVTNVLPPFVERSQRKLSEKPCTSWM